MPTYSSHYYDIRPRRPGWSWAVYDHDKITPIGRGTADTKEAADAAVRACVDRLLHSKGGALGPTP